MPEGNFKVCICGAAGGIGQPLAMLVSLNQHVSELALYDLSVSPVPVAGVAKDLSHVERKCSIKAYSRDVSKSGCAADVLEEALTGCRLVLVPAGLPRKPGMDRAHLLNTNLSIAEEIMEACARYCPEAIVGLIVNPVNSIVPAMAEFYKSRGLDPLKVIGITTLDVVRANKFVHEVTGESLDKINIPVVGGHAGATILPLFSQDPAANKLSPEQKVQLDKLVQDAGTEVVNAKGGKGSATLSMAYAGARFARAVLSGLAGDRRTECAYVASTVTELPYFTSKVTFGPAGVEKVHELGPLSEYEKKRVQEVLKQLRAEIEAGTSAMADTTVTLKLQPATPDIIQSGPGATDAVPFYSKL